MLTALIVTIHIICSVALVVMILLHSGKGGGLSDLFGGGLNSSAAGSTVVERNLDRATIVTVVAFMFTTVILGVRLQ